MTHYTTRERVNVNAYADWLNSEPWSAFCTFTTSTGLSLKKARRTMETFKEVLTAKHASITKIFWVAEPFRDRRDYHVHALVQLAPSEVLASELITSAWHEVCKPSGYKMYNRIMVQEYIKDLGAHYYISKNLRSAAVDYDLL